MAKKVVASFQVENGKKPIKVIKMKRKGENYIFEEMVLSEDKVKEFLNS